MAQNQTPKIYLNGKVPLSATANVAWELNDGTLPFVNTFDLPKGFEKVVDRTLRGKEPVTLTIQIFHPVKRKVTIKNLWVLEFVPGPNEHIRRIRVADRRWFWSYPMSFHRYNHTKRTGYKGISRNDLFDLQDVIQDIQYARWSTQDEKTKPWTPDEMVQQVINEVMQAEKEYRGGSAEYKIIVDPEIKKTKNTLPLLNTSLQDSGNTALDRAIAYFPEAAISITEDGDIHIRSRVNNAEVAEMKKVFKVGAKDIQHHIVGDGHIQLVDNRITGPSQIDVYYIREPELRFDYFEEDNRPAGFTTAIGDPAEDNFMENVLPVPDVGLKIDGVEVPQGTWITMDQAFKAWGAPPRIGLTQLTHEFVRRAMVPFMDFWSALGLAGLLSPDADWMARIAAVQQHYRQTFRINQRWLDRLLSIHAFRVATINPLDGSRGPAEAFSDYAVLGTQRSFLAKSTANANEAQFGMNVSGYPSDGLIDSNTKSTPADVSVLDSDQGIIRISYRQDNLRQLGMILPSQISVEDEAGNSAQIRLPSGNIRPLPGKLIGYDAVSTGVKYNSIALTKHFKLSVIVTGIPASPNNKRQLQKVSLKPNDVKDIISLPKFQGPRMEIFVGQGMETARMMWRDSKKAEIEKMMGIRDAEPNVEDLVINLRDKGGFRGLLAGASLNSISKGIVARVWAQFITRFEGSASGILTPGMGPAGWIERIIHEVTSKGEAKTKVAMPDKVPPLDIMGWIPEPARRILAKQPPARGGG